MASNGKMILLSDIQGCQDKSKNQYLTKLVCQPKFFQSLEHFMTNDKSNKISFVGNFFDKGSYVISTILHINRLIDNFGDRINLILSFREINKIRFLFELDKSLLKQGIDSYPGHANLEVEKHSKNVL